jgi:predicted nucleic acid-binding protein
MHLLDSDVCIDLLAARPKSRSLEGVRAFVRAGAAISVITYGEVWDGVLRSRTREADARRWTSFLEYVDVLDVSRDIADLWAVLRGELRALGRRLPDSELLIASTALGLGLTLVSRNQRHFNRIRGLQLHVPG